MDLNLVLPLMSSEQRRWSAFDKDLLLFLFLIKRSENSNKKNYLLGYEESMPSMKQVPVLISICLVFRFHPPGSLPEVNWTGLKGACK